SEAVAAALAARLPPAAQALCPMLEAWAATWVSVRQGQMPTSPQLWAALCLLMKMLHVPLVGSPPDEFAVALKTEKSVLEDAAWTIPWQIWLAAALALPDARGGTPRPESPPRPQSPDPPAAPSKAPARTRSRS